MFTAMVTSQCVHRMHIMRSANGLTANTSVMTIEVVCVMCRPGLRVGRRVRPWSVGGFGGGFGGWRGAVRFATYVCVCVFAAASTSTFICYMTVCMCLSVSSSPGPGSLAVRSERGRMFNLIRLKASPPEWFNIILVYTIRLTGRTRAESHAQHKV